MKPLEQVYWWRLGFGVSAAFLAVGYLLLVGAINSNLVLNPSVEIANSAGPQNWSSSGNGTIWNNVANYVRTGSRSLEIDVTNSSGEWIGNVSSISGGKSYHIDCWVDGEITSGQFMVAIDWLIPNANTVENSITLSNGTYKTWTLVKGDFTSPDGATGCQMVFRANNASGVMYADDFEVRQPEPIQSFFNSASIAVIVYIASYYALKGRYGTKVAKPQKILTAGIGIYILAWLAIWTLLYTVLAGV